MDDQPGCRQVGTVWAGHPLLTQRLRLRPLTEADAPALAEMLDDWQLVKHTANIPHPYGLDDAIAFVSLMASRAQARTGMALAMERSVDRRLVGCIGFGTESDGTPEIGYWVGREFWGAGLATEAARRLIRHLFADLGFTRVWASAHPDNAASRRVLDKVGLRLAGHQMIGQPARGQSVVMPVMELDADSWRQAHAGRPKLLVVAAALIDPDGRVLMASRPEGRSMAGLWEFPGGKVAEGETPEQALVRELAEELGIDTGESCLAPIAFASHDYDTFHLLMPLYAVRVWQGNPIAQEGQQLTWCHPNRLGDLPMPPADIPLLALLRDWV